MVDVVFSLDVEDVVYPESDDALKTLCEIFTREDVPLSLFVAGEKARIMRRRGRHDVIDAMRPHEICYHGNYFGDFPEPAIRYGSRLPFDEAVSLAMSVETKGLHDVAEITGQFPVAWCAHQSQQSLPLQYALKLAGVRCWAGGPRGWFMNWLSWPRSNCDVSLQGDWTMPFDPLHPDRVKPVSDVAADLRAAQADFEKKAEQNNFIVFLGHPCCWAASQWTYLFDYATLFRYGSAGPYPRPPPGGLIQPRSAADREAAFDMVRKLLRWIRKRTDVNLTNYTSLCDRDEEDPVHWISWPRLVTLARRIHADFDALTDDDTSFSPADVLGMLLFAVTFLWQNNRWPDQIPVQRPLGPTEEPLSSGGPLTVDRSSLIAGSLAAYSILMDERRLFGRLRASFKDVGPAELLHLLCRFILAYDETGQLPESVSIEAVPALPKAVNTSAITDRRFGSSNMPPAQDMGRLWDLLRWQSWSYRPAVSGRNAIRSAGKGSHPCP